MDAVVEEIPPTVTVEDAPGSTGRANTIVRGTTFKDTFSMRIAIEREQQAQNRGIRAGKGGGSRQKVYICSGADIGPDGVNKGCGAIWRAVKTRNGEWRLSSVTNEHSNCNGGEARASLQSIIPEAAAAVSVDPSIKCTTLAATLKRCHGITVSRRQANRAKAVIINSSIADQVDGYRALPAYLTRLKYGSPETVTDLQTNLDGSFARCFIMLGKAAHAISQSALKVFAMGRGHLKGTWNGVLLTLSGLDSNNNLIILATAIVPEESTDTYVYLLDGAMKNSKVATTLNSHKSTILSDRHNGAGQAILHCLPKAEHRNCVLDIMKNLRDETGEEGVRLISAAGRAPLQAIFMRLMNQLKVSNPKAYDELMAVPHSSWTNYASRENAIGDHICNRFTEWNMSAIGEAMEKPVYDLLHAIVLGVAKEFCDRGRITSNNNYIPHAMREFENQQKDAGRYSVISVGDGIYMVWMGGVLKNGVVRTEEHRVKLHIGSGDESHTMECVCAYPQRHRIPCCHVLAVTSDIGASHLDLGLIDERYLLSVYRRSYSSSESPAIEPPVRDELARDNAMRPPLHFEGQGGHPKGKKKTHTMKRKYSIEEDNFCREYNSATVKSSTGGAGAGPASMSLPEGRSANSVIGSPSMLGL
ncbi:unnamed protein product [Choristocarpus tenellus]